MTKTVSLITVLLVGLLVVVSVSSAQDIDKEKLNAKIVFRIYQATYGADERCKQSSPQVSEAVVKFTKTYPELMELVEQSPYYDQAKSDMAELVKNNPKADCLALLNILKELTDTEYGKQEILETINQLKK